MSHWSQTANAAANASMGTQAPDAPVRDCETREWEPLAEITPMPMWTLAAVVLSAPETVPPPFPPPAPAAAPAPSQDQAAATGNSDGSTL
jgi:hypothetical protein